MTFNEQDVNRDSAGKFGTKTGSAPETRLDAPEFNPQDVYDAWLNGEPHPLDEALDREWDERGIHRALSNIAYFESNLRLSQRDPERWAKFARDRNPRAVILETLAGIHDRAVRVATRGRSDLDTIKAVHARATPGA